MFERKKNMNQENMVRLSPPWNTYHNFIRESIGSDPWVTVSDIAEISGSQHLIRIAARTEEKARALATILALRHSFGNVNLDIEILHNGSGVSPYEPPLTVTDLIRIFNQALGTNSYFVNVKPGVLGIASVFPIFKKEVIQFFNDDISDFYNNYNGVASSVFAEVLRPDIYGTYINPSTAQGSDCNGQSRLVLFVLLLVLLGMRS